MDAEQHPVERWTSHSLKAGVLVSGVVMIAGLVWYAVRAFAAPLPLHNPTIAQLLHDLLTGSLDPFTLMYIGLILLMLTPFLRVLTAVVGFAVQKDRTFVFVSLTVFFFLIAELLYSLYQ